MSVSLPGRIFASAALLALAFLVLAGLTTTSASAAGEGLFAAAPAPLAAPALSEATALRTTFVSVNFESLTSFSDRLTLNLFDDATFAVSLREVEQMGDGGFVWKGTIDGMGDSLVMLSVLDGTLQGNITTETGALYAIRYIEKDLHGIYQLDPAGFGRDEEPIEVRIPKVDIKDFVSDDAGVVENMAPTITVMVAYTSAASNAAGGTTAMNNLVNLAVSETNTGYANSGVNQRISLVWKGLVSYTESGNMSTDLGRLRATADGYMDSLHTTRNTYAADLVGLIVNNGGGSCGIAYKMSTVSTSFKTNGFSVTARNCATGYYSFGHELGHNMGAGHDSYVDSSTTPYAYAHGWVHVPGKWRTIMAYNNKCSASGVSCTRINYWSNPAKSYGGAVMGNTSTADNRRTLNNTATTVAAFR